MTHQKKTNSQTYISKSLSVQVSLTGHSFLVKDVSINSVLFSHSTMFETTVSPDEALIALIETLNEFEALQETFEQITIVHQNDLVTLVPQSLFDEHEAVNYLKFNTKILPTDFIAFDVINSQKMVVVYVPYVNINNYFFETFGSFQYYHTSTIAVKQSLSSFSFKERAQVAIDVTNNAFFCTVVANGKLALHNVYSYKTDEDFLYYVLFCFEQLQLDPNSTPITLSGSIKKEDDLYAVLYKYIRHIQLVDIIALDMETQKAQENYILLKATE